jgi:hypothetical protein
MDIEIISFHYRYIFTKLTFERNIPEKLFIKQKKIYKGDHHYVIIYEKPKIFLV